MTVVIVDVLACTCMVVPTANDAIVKTIAMANSPVADITDFFILYYKK
jgi:hypothetical protein